MSRCYVCDYSDEDVPESIYHSGIHAPDSRRNRIIRGTIEGKDICLHCMNLHPGADDLRAEDALEAYLEMKEIDEETVY
jgi:hypothetical protein